MSPGGGDDISLMDIPRNDGEMNEEERQREVRLFQERINKGGKPLNIAFIGAAGSGKSSLCNSIMAAFSVGCWRERATVGHFGGLGEQVTHHLLSFPKVEYLDFDELYDYNYPTMVDMNGFEDISDELTKELLRIVFFGRLPHEGKLMDAVNLSTEKGLIGLREHFSQNHEDLKIDRIIFVASATSSLPTHLMEAVRTTARKEGRVIPIFGVLTHKDEVDRSDAQYKQQEKDFLEGLGLPENRFLLCTTYCDAYDKHVGKSRLDHIHPELDIPILKFMRQVCDTASKVIKDKTSYNEGRQGPSSSTRSDKPPPEDRQTNQSEVSQRDDLKLKKMFLKGVIIAVFAWVIMLLSSYSDMDALHSCSQHWSKYHEQPYLMKSKIIICVFIGAFSIFVDYMFGKHYK